VTVGQPVNLGDRGSDG